MNPCSTSDRCTGTFRSLSVYALGGASSVLLCSNLLYYLLCRYCSWLDCYCSCRWFTILYTLLNLCIVEWDMVSRLWIISRERYYKNGRGLLYGVPRSAPAKPWGTRLRCVTGLRSIRAPSECEQIHSFAIITLWKVRRKRHFAQVGIEYTCVYTVQGNPGVVRTPKYFNPTGCSMTVPLSVLSPISILPPSSSPRSTIPARKNSAHISNVLFQVFSPLKMALSLQLCKQ
jgi:hypothetical protein